MQDATPITLGQEFAAYAVAVRKCNQHIIRTAEDLAKLGLGGSAVGTGLNTHPDYRAKAIANLSRISGQHLKPAEDLRYAMQSNPAWPTSPPRSAPSRSNSSASRTTCACSPAAPTPASTRSTPQPPTRLQHHARQGQPRPRRTHRHGRLPGHRQRHRHRLAVQAGQLELNVMMPTMAHNTLQSITILTNTLRAARPPLHPRHHRQRSPLRPLRQRHHLPRHRAQPLHRLRRRRRNRQRKRQDRPHRHRNRPRTPSPRRSRPPRNPRSHPHDRADRTARRCQIST